VWAGEVIRPAHQAVLLRARPVLGEEAVDEVDALGHLDDGELHASVRDGAPIDVHALVGDVGVADIDTQQHARPPPHVGLVSATG
jgi:hypothetical protein